MSKVTHSKLSSNKQSARYIYKSEKNDKKSRDMSGFDESRNRHQRYPSENRQRSPDDDRHQRYKGGRNENYRSNYHRNNRSSDQPRSRYGDNNGNYQPRRRYDDNDGNYQPRYRRYRDNRNGNYQSRYKNDRNNRQSDHYNNNRYQKPVQQKIEINSLNEFPTLDDSKTTKPSLSLARNKDKDVDSLPVKPVASWGGGMYWSKVLGSKPVSDEKDDVASSAECVAPSVTDKSEQSEQSEQPTRFNDAWDSD